MDRSKRIVTILMAAMVLVAVIIIVVRHPAVDPEDRSNSWTVKEFQNAFTEGKTTKVEVIQYLNRHRISYRQIGRPPAYDRLDIFRPTGDPGFFGTPVHEVVFAFDRNDVLTAIIPTR